MDLETHTQMEKYATSGGYFEWINRNILTFTVTKEESDPQNVIDYFDKLTELTAGSDSNFVLILDASKGKWMSEGERKITAEKLQAYNAKHQGRVLKRYYVLTSIVVRMMLKAIELLAYKRTSREKHIFSSKDKAIDAAENYLKEKHVIAATDTVK